MRILVPAALVCAFLSCSTMPKDNPLDFSEAPFFGMLYDHTNHSVSNADILVDGEKRAVTDINGRFVVINLGKGSHTITVCKEGYETLVAPVGFFNRTNVAYLKIISVEQLIETALAFMDSRKWEDASECITRVERIEKDNVLALYLRAALSYMKREFTAAELCLKTILELGYDDAYVHLFLADLYEYELLLPLSALEHLQRISDTAFDNEIEQRTIRLRQMYEDPPL